jgi:hypothetical protein
MLAPILRRFSTGPTTADYIGNSQISPSDCSTIQLSTRVDNLVLAYQLNFKSFDWNAVVRYSECRSIRSLFLSLTAAPKGHLSWTP